MHSLTFLETGALNQSFRKPCVIANWKMHGSRKGIIQLVEALLDARNYANIEIVLCAPSVYLQTLQTALHGNSNFELGAQNVYCESSGAFTGEVSPEMLVDLGCSYVIIGHSERRKLFFEDDTLIARKCVAAYHAGLTPILCIGETAAEREAGKTYEVVSRQLGAVVEKLPIEAFRKVMIAYEPVWAIGTGLTATPEQTEAVHDYLRNWLRERDTNVAEKARIVYGGSVNAENALALLKMPNIDGALVGGASLIAAQFLKICESALINKSES